VTQAATPVQVAVATPAWLGESPLWHPTQQVLYYADVPRHQLLRFDPQTGTLKHWQFNTELASLAPFENGDLLLAMRDGLWRFDPQTGQRTLLAEPPYNTANERFNDGKCDAQGRFWVGTLYEPRDAPHAALYCLSGGQLQRRQGDLTNVNGLAWSPDGRTMHWCDTKAHTVYSAAFDPTTGMAAAPQIFASFAHKQAHQALSSYGGRPDGAAMDTEGCYWVAMFEGQRLLRLSPRGEVVCEVKLPVRCPTMPCFGGADLKTLYVTTARHNRPADELLEQPLAGCVLALKVDVPGLVVNFYETHTRSAW
jgi:sugar lactone lactonase YvrE